MRVFKNEISWRRFFTYLSLIVFGWGLALLGFVFVVDPYQIWRNAATPGLNEIKLEAPTALQLHEAMLKSATQHPDVLILGSSRVRRAFNQAHASQVFGAKVQVIGIDGLPLPVARELFVAIGKHTFIKKLYLEVSYFTSNACGALSNFPPVENRLDMALFHLMVPTAARQSMETLRINLRGPRAYDTYIDAQGNYQQNANIPLATNHAIQISKERQFKKIASNCHRQSAPAADFKDMEAIFQLAQANNTEVVLLILPSTVQWHARVRQAGLEPVFSKWKEHTFRYAKQLHFKLIDYEYATDFPDAAPTPVGMPLYWDETHFSNRIGQYLLTVMAQPEQMTARQER
jgi:hypothetical protein